MLTLSQVGYDLLVGADGAGSVVRSALQHIMPDNYIRRYRHKQVYSMTQVTPSDPAKIPAHAVFQAHPIKVCLCCLDSPVNYLAALYLDAERCSLLFPFFFSKPVSEKSAASEVVVKSSGGGALVGCCHVLAFELIMMPTASTTQY